MMKGDRHYYFSQEVWETGEFRYPEFGEYFVNGGDRNHCLRHGWDGARPMRGIDNGNRIILSPHFQEPEKAPEPKAVVMDDGDFDPPEACYCSAMGRLAPCSWCTDPANDPDLVAQEVAP